MLNLLFGFVFTSSILSRGNTHDFYSTFLQTPDPPLFSCPYQEDLISSIQFLRDARATKKGNIENLMDLMKTSSRKVIKRKAKDEIRLETAVYTPNVSESHSIDFNNASNHETETPKDEPAIVRRRVKKILRPIQNNEENIPEMSKQIFEINEQTIDQTYANQETQSEGNFHNVLPPILVPTALQRDTIYDQKNTNSAKNNIPVFNIPYQRVSDVLDESTFRIPEAAYCKNSNWRSNTNLNQQRRKPNFHNSDLALKNSITCSESDETVAMLFKPKTISLMQVCDNLLKKITVTVLAPYHVSKIGI